jgi:hypothetical protein
MRVMNDGSILGLKAAHLVAGFFGGVLSLSYLTPLTNVQRVSAVASGALAAGYCTPFLYLNLTKILPEVEMPANGEVFVGFFVGLTAMSVLGVGYQVLGKVLRRKLEEA